MKDFITILYLSDERQILTIKSTHIIANLIIDGSPTCISYLCHERNYEWMNIRDDHIWRPRSFMPGNAMT